MSQRRRSASDLIKKEEESTTTCPFIKADQSLECLMKNLNNHLQLHIRMTEEWFLITVLAVMEI